MGYPGAVEAWLPTTAQHRKQELLSVNGQAESAISGLVRLCRGVTIRAYRASDFDEAARMVHEVYRKFVAPDGTAAGAAWWLSYLSPFGHNRERLKER